MARDSTPRTLAGTPASRPRDEPRPPLQRPQSESVSRRLPRSIFQLKDEHEIGSVRPEAKGVRKDEAGERPRFLSLVLDLKWRNRRRADGNVPIPLGLRDWQGAVGRVENLILV